MKRIKGVRPRGDWIEIDFTYANIRRRELIKLSPTSENLKFAAAKRRSILDKITLGTFKYEEEFPDSAWVKKYKKQEVTNSLASELSAWFQARTYKHSAGLSARGYVGFLCKNLGSLKPHELTVEHLEALVKEMQGRRITIKTINNRLGPLRGTLERLMKKGIIQRNPMDLLEIEKPEWEKIRANEAAQIDPFTLEEMNAIIRVAKPKDWLINLVIVGFWTGMRIGELFGLAWEDIDFVHGTLRIRRARTMKLLCTPKSGSFRTIQLFPPALAALKAQKALTFLLEPVDCGDFGNLTFVFRRRNGRPWLEDWQLRVRIWHTLLKRAGVRYRYPYQMRHTFATNCISAGENDRWLATYLGHKTVEMVRRIYAKWWRSDVAKLAGNDGGDKVKALWEIGNEAQKAAAD